MPYSSLSNLVDLLYVPFTTEWLRNEQATGSKLGVGGGVSGYMRSTGEAARFAKCLLSKHADLSSIPSTLIKKARHRAVKIALWIKAMAES